MNYTMNYSMSYSMNYLGPERQAYQIRLQAGRLETFAALLSNSTGRGMYSSRLGNVEHVVPIPGGIKYADRELTFLPVSPIE